MKNKIIGILVCMLMIATAIPAVGTVTSDISSTYVEVVDQHQYDCPEFQPITSYEYEWQEFVPTKNNLARVEVYVCYYLLDEGYLYLTIEQPLGTVMFEKGLSANKLPEFPEFNWVSFGKIDIATTPGIPYYIVLYNDGGNFYWGGVMVNEYPQGNSSYDPE